MTSLQAAQKLKAKFGAWISEPMEFRAEISVRLSDAEKIVEICNYAKNDLDFNYLVDITSLDHYGDDPRWTILYFLRGLRNGCELRIRTDVSEEKSKLPSVVGVWSTANWHEREIYDMMGIHFREHPDLRRILMWDGYPYFPLRKDFPLAGKETELPGVAFTKTTPMMGGPFVTVAGGNSAMAREPRIRIPETDEIETIGRLERRHDIREAHGHPKGPGPIEKK
ncbi:MAG: NADH-quinone oxidoreductase subunit C [Verrucomicrobia bacterium]|nr:NADH-quinone oxidoreductase subunit C [Verrucomicrobiota bacterium]MDE3098809.1 NADH-quinone oxidoreductase subunit C [Verrucomicrobiota bacterium]